MSSYLIGQRVLLNEKEIGTVEPAPKGTATVTPAGFVWVYSPTGGYASCFAEHNVKSLPNGQL
jgi:hypothetical protein